MASAGSEAFTACPRCHSLCVGNATLPCGHVICRKCVRRILQNEPKPKCPNCDCGIPRYQGQTIRQTIDQLDSDPVLEELVNEQLVRQSPSDCRKCDKMTATRVCLDCGCKDCGKCCGSCCARDHVVQDLASIAKNPKKAVTEPKPAAASQSCQRTASRKSELNSAFRTLEELEEKLPKLLSVVKEDLEEKNQLLTRYQVSGALQSEEGSLAVRVNRLLEFCRPPCLDRLKEGVNTLLHPQHSRPIFPEGDIVGRYNTLIAQLHPKRVSEVTDRLPPHIEEVRKLNLFNVDVSVIGPEPPQEIREKEGTPPGPSSHDVHIDRCHDLTMEVHNITIHIGDRLAKLQVMTDTNIKAAVTDALVAKITWDEDRERKLRELRQQHIDELRREVGKVNEEKRKVEAELEEARQEVERVRQETNKLKTQLSEAKARGLEGEKYRKELERRLQQAQERLRNAEIRVVILEQMLGEEKSKGDKRLADIIRLYEDKKRVEEQVMTFVIQVEEAHRQLLAGRHLDKQRLSDVIQRLFQQFNIRLLGADCGLRFLLDAPVSQWVKVVEKQMEVQAVLSDLIPEDARRAVAWAEVTPFGPSGEDIDLQIGRPLPVPDTFPATDPIEKSVKPRRPTEQRLETRPSNRMMAFSPLTATPRRTFCVDNSQLMIQGDEEWPDIPSLVVTDKGLIVIADIYNKKVKVVDSRSPVPVSSLSLDVKPHGLAILHDGLLAVTPDSDFVIHLINIIAQPRVVKLIKTARWYQGVGCGGQGTLIVSCDKRNDLPASLDLISREGQLLRTIVDGHLLPGLHLPRYLSVAMDVVLVSDWSSDCVFRVEMATGRLIATHTHSELKSPRQVAADRSGNLFIASWGGRCLLVMGSDGRWRTLLTGEKNEEGEDIWPVSVAVTDTGVVVGWVDSSVTGYDLT